MNEWFLWELMDTRVNGRFIHVLINSPFDMRLIPS